MSDKIAPALTPEQWEQATTFNLGSSANPVHCVLNQVRGTLYGLNGHAMTALALHLQPFGFTREDVKALRRLTILLPLDDVAHLHGVPGAGAIHHLAARIEALLPPEGT